MTETAYAAYVGIDWGTAAPDSCVVVCPYVDYVGPLWLLRETTDPPDSTELGR